MTLSCKTRIVQSAKIQLKYTQIPQIPSTEFLLLRARLDAAQNKQGKEYNNNVALFYHMANIFHKSEEENADDKKIGYFCNFSTFKCQYNWYPFKQCFQTMQKLPKLPKYLFGCILAVFPSNKIMQNIKQVIQFCCT